MKEKNKKLWLELYSIVDKILKLEPWYKLTDNNLLMYISNKKRCILFCHNGLFRFTQRYYGI